MGMGPACFWLLNNVRHLNKWELQVHEISLWAKPGLVGRRALGPFSWKHLNAKFIVRNNGSNDEVILKTLLALVIYGEYSSPWLWTLVWYFHRLRWRWDVLKGHWVIRQSRTGVIYRCFHFSFHLSEVDTIKLIWPCLFVMTRLMSTTYSTK